MTTAQRDAYVAEKLGIDGWKPRRECSRLVNRTWEGCRCYSCGFAVVGGPLNPFDHLAEHVHKHEIPPPNLRSLEGMAKLLIALADKSCEVIFQNYDGLQVCVYLNAHRQKVGDTPDGYGFDEHSWPDALADAAYNALEQDPK